MIPTICIGGFNDKKLEMTKNAGFKYVELNFGEMALKSETEGKEYLARLSDMGFIPVAGNCFVPWILRNENGFFRDTFDIGEFKEYVDMAFEKTKAVKWNSIAFGSGKYREMPEGYDRDKAYEFFGSIISDIIVPKLEKYDATLSIEELNSAETNFVNSCRDALSVVKSVNHPRVGILCDYYHMSLSGETASDVPDFAEHNTHLHIASPANKRAIPVANDGDNDNYTAFFEALKKCGYDKKYLSVEGHLPEEDAAQPKLCDCYSYLSSLSGAF